MTALGVGAWPAIQFRLEVTGRGFASAGKTVRKLDEVDSSTVTFIVTPVAMEGMVQLPLVPHTAATSVSSPCSGVARGPTLSEPGRVSTSRQAVIGTNDDITSWFAADAVSTPLAPSRSARGRAMPTARVCLGFRAMRFDRPDRRSPVPGACSATATT